MNFNRAEQLFSRLMIKHRDTHEMVRFRFFPNQAKLHSKLKAQWAREHKIRAVILKGRRITVSSYCDALLFAHCMAYSNAESKIVAHLASSVEDLFRVPRDFANSLPLFEGDVQTKRIYFNHLDGESRMTIATAGTPGAGRGSTLSALHLSEAAQYEAEGSFLSLLPSVSKGPNSIVLNESTPFGRGGIGEPFYEFWKQAEAGENGYEPIFLSWLDDPTWIGDPEEAEDAPADDLEKELMSPPFNASRAQIAWKRRTMASECQNYENKWLQEYGHSPRVCFVSSGDPVFPRDEQNYVEALVHDPIATGTMVRDLNGGVRFSETTKGMLLVWQRPVPGHRYYIGADAALGLDHGDFAAYSIFDGTTGLMAARFADRIHPELMAEQLNLVGRWYNNGMINVELTGNLGRITQKLLRDHYRYPSIYVWKGKDDRKVGKSNRISIGWETTSYSRQLMVDTFRVYLRAGMNGDPGGLILLDKELLRQMSLAEMKEYRWEVTKGHDDILFASMLAVVTCSQYPPPKRELGNWKPDMTGDISGFLRPHPDLDAMMKQDFGKLSTKAGRMKNWTIPTEQVKSHLTATQQELAIRRF